MNRPLEIVLEWYEMAMASEVGRLRQIAAVRRNLQDKYGCNASGWDTHIEGACGELAAAKALRVYWSGSVNTFALPDLGPFQVRTRSRHDYDLIVRSSDDSEAAYILVTGKCPNYRVHGWIYGHEAKRKEYLKTYGDRPPAYFVPQAALRSINAIEAAHA